MVTRTMRSDHAPVTMRVPFAASSVSVARQQLKLWMSENGGSSDTIDDARVIISELVGNSIRHAQPLPDGNILITWTPEESGLQLSVTDGGSPTRPRKVNAPASALAGRGMAIVETLAISWWAEQTRSKSTVHAVLPMD
ncbi:MAG: ATP-binding protein [Nocardioidaceae bacterium]